MPHGVTGAEGAEGTATEATTLIVPQVLPQEALTFVGFDILRNTLTALKTFLVDSFNISFNRQELLDLTSKAQKYLSPLFFMLALFSCFTNGGLNVFTGVVNLSWFEILCGLIMTPVWNGLNIVFALLISPDYFAEMRENPTIANKLKAYSNFYYHSLGLFLATAWATYSIITETTEKEPLSSAVSDAAFGGGEILVALYALQRLMQSTNPDDSIRALSAIMTSGFCAAGAAGGSDSMVSSSRYPLYSSAGLYGAYSISNFAGKELARLCLRLTAKTAEEDTTPASAAAYVTIN